MKVGAASSRGPNGQVANWRLPDLRLAIKDNKLRSFEELIKDPDFYGEPLRRLNYAQVRYLMLYLQEKGLLTRFYTAFRDHAAADPTGLATLKELVAPQSLDDFERDWRAWVLKLEFR